MLAADNDKHQLLYTLLENSAYNAIEQIHHKSFNQYHKSKLLKSSLFYKEQSRINLDSFCFILSFLWAKKGNGGAKRDRTADLLRARQALSQLS